MVAGQRYEVRMINNRRVMIPIGNVPSFYRSKRTLQGPSPQVVTPSMNDQNTNVVVDDGDGDGNKEKEKDVRHPQVITSDVLAMNNNNGVNDNVSDSVNVDDDDDDDNDDDEVMEEEEDSLIGIPPPPPSFSQPIQPVIPSTSTSNQIQPVEEIPVQQIQSPTPTPSTRPPLRYRVATEEEKKEKKLITQSTPLPPSDNSARGIKRGRVAESTHEEEQGHGVTTRKRVRVSRVLRSM